MADKTIFNLLPKRQFLNNKHKHDFINKNTSWLCFEILVVKFTCNSIPTGLPNRYLKNGTIGHTGFMKHVSNLYFWFTTEISDIISLWDTYTSTGKETKYTLHLHTLYCNRYKKCILLLSSSRYLEVRIIFFLSLTSPLVRFILLKNVRRVT